MIFRVEFGEWRVELWKLFADANNNLIGIYCSKT